MRDYEINDGMVSLSLSIATTWLMTEFGDVLVVEMTLCSCIHNLKLSSSFPSLVLCKELLVDWTDELDQVMCDHGPLFLLPSPL